MTFQLPAVPDDVINISRLFVSAAFIIQAILTLSFPIPKRWTTYLMVGSGLSAAFFLLFGFVGSARGYAIFFTMLFLLGLVRSTIRLYGEATRTGQVITDMRKGEQPYD